MPRTFAIDSGNSARLGKRIFAVDSGNVTRLAKRIFVIDSGNSARLIFASQITFTMTAGQQGTTKGYQNGTIGSVSSVTNLDAGLTIQKLYDETTGFTN